MLEALDLNKSLSAPEYKQRLPGLRRYLHQLQRACHSAEVGTIVVFEGWDTSAKSATVRKLVQRLEPRAFSTYAIHAPRTYETQLPWMWRFWVKVPNWGEMAIFDRSWYGRVLVERFEGAIEQADWMRAYRDIVGFERALVHDRYEIVKFFFHISKAEKRKRLEEMEADPLESWRVKAENWDELERYGDRLEAAEEMLEHTDTEWAPWTLIEATDRRWLRVRVMETLIQRMKLGLEKRGAEVPEPLIEQSAEALS